MNLNKETIEEMLENPNMYLELNQKIKKLFLNMKNIDSISKAITIYAFRNGPIEDLHADISKNITDKDMKILNKFMVNKIANIFTLIIEERWLELTLLIEYMNTFYGREWDKAELNKNEIKNLVKNFINLG